MNKSGFTNCTIFSGLALLLVPLLVGCETPRPDKLAATPLSMGEQQHGVIDPQKTEMATLWKVVRVGAPGNLSVHVSFDAPNAQARLFVYKENSNSTLLKRNLESADSKNQVELRVEPGLYYLGVHANKYRTEFNVAAKFVPHDPDSESGANRNRDGANALPENGVVEGIVSFRDANQTDWYKYVATKAGFVTFDFLVKDETIGITAELYEKDKLLQTINGTLNIEIKNPGNYFVKVVAPKVESVGAYRLSNKSIAAFQGDKIGAVIRFHENLITINLGSDDGIKPGFRGFVRRTNGTMIEFLVERVLKRTSNARLKEKLSDSDLNLPVELRAAL